MKKIFTLLFVAGSISFASAQNNGKIKQSNDFKKETKDIGFNQSRPGTVDNGKFSVNSSVANRKEKERQIQQINREFDKKISAVKMNRWMKAYEKNKQIRLLEKQRNDQIKQVEYRFDKSWKGDDRFAKTNNHHW